MAFRNVRDKLTGKLICRYDPATRCIEVRDKGKRYAADLSEYDSGLHGAECENPSEGLIQSLNDFSEVSTCPV